MYTDAIGSRKLTTQFVLQPVPKASGSSASQTCGKLYKQRARWMDYSPEAAKQIVYNYIETLQELVGYLKQDGIAVEVISTEL